MNRSHQDETINIRPGVSILSVLPHLNYKPWFALAEFVDNSLQSFQTYRKDIERAEGRPVRLEVSIELNHNDGGRIIIRDNAAGIHEADYARAFRPAAVPPDRNGLSEFGMGMKSAACWFAGKWTVRTKALGEEFERTVHFDIAKIVRDDLEELTVKIHPADRAHHYTEIVLTDLHNFPRGQTIRKVKEHLASIYRAFTRDGTLLLRFEDEMLSYTDPRVLIAPFYKDPSGPPVRWRKEIDIDLGLGLRARGFAALRETASTSTAGFALFRRNRLIMGSADEPYRPATIFGAPNSFTYQRLFGELQLHGFDVSHTKDGFQWNDLEDTFLELLADELNAAPIPLLFQAEGYRAKLKPADVRSGADAAAAHTAEAIKREVPSVLERQLDLPPEPNDPLPVLQETSTVSHRVIDVELKGVWWQITLELSTDPAVSDWVEISDRFIQANTSLDDNVRQLGVRLALAHPFMERFGGSDAQRIEPLLRVAAALALAETTARHGGVKMAGVVRYNLNELLRDALSKP